MIKAGNGRPWFVSVTLMLNLVWALGVALCSLLCVFFYQYFVTWIGQPYDGLLRLNPWLMRPVFLAGTLFYLLPAWGCWRMWRGLKGGFRIYVIPALMVFAAALFFVFNVMNLLQVILYAGSLLVLGSRKWPA